VRPASTERRCVGDAGILLQNVEISEIRKEDLFSEAAARDRRIEGHGKEERARDRELLKRVQKLQPK